eukprot:NODE_4869_length_750_cov_17.878745_g4515_i0.p2 GENE.NODE_4869_length_750_cov_17.878745_g4515_i0~~NODE_4869_length_750_cov_17.878745_g4515_i0.p2  ORF type:complete len:112 (+),score=34.68 NODE_4869_length_750_cov_17.878745_g4515_i0:148-483(+)
MSQEVKQLKLKSGVLKRNLKDFEYSCKEVTREEQRLEKMRADGKDESTLKQQKQCLSEAVSGVSEAKGRALKARADLQDFLDANLENAEIRETEDFTAATAMLAQADELLA